MTFNAPVQRVVDKLSSVGYRLQSSPIKVSTVPFEFSAMLLGADRSHDLIVVIDTLGEDSAKRILHKVGGLSRALDLAASKRPLTIVLVGPAPELSILESLSRVCRVLIVGAAVGPDAVHLLDEALAVLLPLDLSQTNALVADPLSEVRAIFTDRKESTDFSSLFDAAIHGNEEVREALRSLLSIPFIQDDAEGTP